VLLLPHSAKSIIIATIKNEAEVGHTTHTHVQEVTGCQCP
jgi:hypothetical protein